MAGLFFRLKLRLLRNGLRAGWQRTVGLVLGALFALPLAAVGFALLAVGGHDAEAAQPLAVLGCTALFVSWISIPVLGFGTDETLDPSRLVTYPLERRQLMAGLFTASSVGVAPVATLIGLAGALVGYARLGPGAIVVVGAVVVEFGMCIAGSRAVVTALSRLLRTRRGRDLMVATAAAIALAPQLLRIALEPRAAEAGGLAATDFGPAAQALRWSPPGLAGQAMADAAGGRWARGAGELVLSAAFVALLLWWWSRSLEHTMTTVDTTTAAPPRRHRRLGGARGRRDSAHAGGRAAPSAAPLVPSWLRWLPPTRAGAVAAREVRYAGRDPRRRIQILMGLLVPIFAMLPALLRGGLHHHEIVLVAVFVSFMFATTTSLNSIGMDGPAYWANVVAGNDPRADLLGKNTAALVLGIPLTTLLAVVLAALSGGWAYVPLVVCLAAGILGVGVGVGDVASVRAPQPVADSPNPWAQNSGQGCATGFLAMLAFAAEVVLMVPIAIVVGVGFAWWRPALVLAAPLALALGAVVWRAGLSSAERWAWWRLPELLDAVSPRRA